MEEEIPMVFMDNNFYRYCGERLVKICDYEKCNNLQRYSTGFCFKHKLGLDYKEPEEYKGVVLIHENQVIRDRSRGSGIRGDKSEIFILNILTENKDISSVERIGQTFDRYDIKYKLNDNEFRGLQVKNFVKVSKRSNTYTGIVKKIYDSNTLLVFINKEENKFGILFYKDCPKESLTINFNNLIPKYKDNMFTDIEKFKNKLFSMLPYSVIYKQILSKNHTTEYEHFTRLEKICKNYNLTFKLNETSGSVIDSFIGNHKIQNKVSNSKCKKALKYNFSLHKSSHREGEKRISMPYSDKDDIDYFIFEIVPHENNFYIIPMKILIDKGYITTETIKGKQSITMPPPDYKKNDWKLNFLNKFELLV